MTPKKMEKKFSEEMKKPSVRYVASPKKETSFGEGLFIWALGLAVVVFFKAPKTFWLCFELIMWFFVLPALIGVCIFSIAFLVERGVGKWLRLR